LQSISHNHVDLPPFVLVGITGVWTPINNSEILLAAVYKSPGRGWIDGDIIVLLSFRLKSILGGDLNVKRQFWNSADSSTSGEKLLHYFM
jgi:hypothetical protein